MAPKSEFVDKVPAVTLMFWVIKIAATTLGETAGDALSMQLHLGYAVSTLIFAILFLISAAIQIRAHVFRPLLYWSVIVATTTVGTTMADFADRSLGVGYVGGSLTLFAALVGVLGLWRIFAGPISFNRFPSAKTETFYWLTILFSNTLGTALGDFLADTSGLGFEGGALVFAGAITLVAVAYYRTQFSPTALFWGGVYSDAPARRDARGHSYKAARCGWARSQPDQFIARPSGPNANGDHLLLEACRSALTLLEYLSTKA